jgi:hypothetical protein
MRFGQSHICLSNVTDNGEPSTDLAFSSTIRPESVLVADIISTDAMGTMMHLIYKGSDFSEYSNRG